MSTVNNGWVTIFSVVAYSSTRVVQRILNCDKVQDNILTLDKVAEQFDTWATFLYHHVHEL